MDNSMTATRRHILNIQRMNERLIELRKLRHRCRKMGTALGMFMAATSDTDNPDINKARNYTRNVLK